MREELKQRGNHGSLGPYCGVSEAVSSIVDADPPDRESAVLRMWYNIHGVPGPLLHLAHEIDREVVVQRQTN